MLRSFFLLVFINLLNTPLFADSLELPNQSLKSLRINSSITKEAVFYGNGTPGPYSLPDRFILIGSDSIFIKDSVIRKDQYQIDYEKGTIVFANAMAESAKVVIRYQRIPFFDLKPLIFRYFPETDSESPEGLTKLAAKLPTLDSLVETGNSLRQNEGEDLLVSGSKTLGFTVSSEQGLGIEQATRLNINGEVAGVQIGAALSDQSSPIPPSGVTKEISELDKILIKVQKGGWSGSFGDYDFIMPFGSFGTVERQATGAMVIGNLGQANIQTSYARPKGKFRKIIFTGKDGIQGPYRLNTSEPLTTIVPASEIVYLDGEKLTRGWNEDYTIDYSLAEITFTNKRIINKRGRRNNRKKKFIKKIKIWKEIKN